jgi:signal transduction histidine kinase
LKDQSYNHDQTQNNPNLKTIIGQISHDIRSPLCSLRMIVHSCTDLSDTQRTALRRVCDRISDIANNLFRYTHPEHQNNTITSRVNTIKPINIVADIMEIVNEKQYEYVDRDIKFTPKFNINSSIFINANSSNFKRAISNIINNSVDAMEDMAGEVTISINKIDEQVQIIIEDKGKGMPGPVCERILSRTPVTFDKANGHGIGYTQIHGMLRESEGRLHIQSRRNIGTKVTLTFYEG